MPSNFPSFSGTKNKEYASPASTPNKEDASPASTPNKDGTSLAPTPNVASIVSVVILLFAIITQALAATGAISLSPAVQVTIWLVVGAFIVALLIAGMVCSAYMTANRCRSSEPPVASPDSSNAGAQRSAEQELSGQKNPDLQVVPPIGPDTSTTARLKDRNAGDDPSARHNGPRLPVKMEDVFPQGCYLVPASISETYDYDEKNKTCRPVVDEITGQPVFECRVVDMDPERKGRSRETEVKIAAHRMPVPPTQTQYGAVEFEGLTAIPYATDRGRVAYISLRATGIKQAIIRPAPGPEQSRPAPGPEQTRPAQGTENVA